MKYGSPPSSGLAFNFALSSSLMGPQVEGSSLIKRGKRPSIVSHNVVANLTTKLGIENRREDEETVPFELRDLIR